MAQHLYDESEDHFTQLKSQNDEEAIKLFQDAVDDFQAVDTENESTIQALIEKVNIQVRSSGSQYFKKAFPQAFD